MSTLILTGGGTAGHCLPHLSILPYIKDSFDKIYYVGSEDGMERKLMADKFEYLPICTAKLKRELSLDNLMILPRLFRGVMDAEKILKKTKPDLVFSKGGYVGMPLILAAARRKIPVISHESDLSLGLANRLTAKKCQYVLTSFKKTADALPNGVYTGPPLREMTLKKERSLSHFGLSGKKPILLVLGGSSGSLSINRAIIGLLPHLLPKYDIVHICGSKHTTGLKKDGYREVPFIEDMSLAYGAADLVISRAGSNTVFELLSLKKPTLFIPLSKKASRGDQILNANYFAALGLCKVMYEDGLELDLLKKIDLLFKDKDYLINKMNARPILNGNKKIGEILNKFS